MADATNQMVSSSIVLTLNKYITLPATNWMRARTHHTFKLLYDSSICVGLYDHGNNAGGLEPYSEGRSVSWPTQLDQWTVFIHGAVVSAPLTMTSSQLPSSGDTENPYVVLLVDGSTIHIPPSLMGELVDYCLASPSVTSIHPWLGTQQKVMYLCDGEYLKGIMKFVDTHSVWQFSQQWQNGEETWGVDLPYYVSMFLGYIVNGILVSGWHTSTEFLQGLAHHVSTSQCQRPFPGSL